jgi:hypothetical protein
MEITKASLEGFLSSFVKQVDSSRQHNYIDQEACRFIFQPIESVYLVIITSKDSNIVEDLETLRLMYKVVQHYCPFGPDEGNVLKNSFDLALAFDDVIASGYRESVTLSQILTYSDMESAEERIFKEKQKAQMQEAREQAKRKQVELDKKRQLEVNRVKDMPPVEDFTREVMATMPSMSGGIGKDGKDGMAGMASVSSTSFERQVDTVQVVVGKKPKAGMALVSRGKKGMEI